MPRQSSAVPLETVADVFARVGTMAAERIRLTPRPGTATEQDVIRLHDRTDRLFELVDGVLVEKVMGHPESALTCDLIKWLGIYLDSNPLGFLTGPDGAARLLPGLVRVPDVSFFAWSQFPSRQRPVEPIAPVAPVLAVEILSPGNTRQEMLRKRRDYFLAGVRLLWVVDPAARTVEVFTAPDASVRLKGAETLTGGDLLPGLALPLPKLFAGLGPSAGPARGRRASKPGRPRQNG